MQDQSLLTVLITNYNTLDFVKVSLLALQKLTINPYKVFINDNGSRPRETAELKNIAKDNPHVWVNFRKSSRKQTSYAHAEALDLLISRVETKYAVVLDSDCTFLMKGWDEYMIRQVDDAVKIVGSPLAKGRSGLKPDDFPFQFAVLFDTAVYKSLNISCMPVDIAGGKDTCWEWKHKFTNGGYKGKVFSALCTRDYKEGPFRSITGVAEYYTEDGRLIGSHYGRGSTQGITKFRAGIYRIPYLSKLLNIYVGLKEKKDWLGICRRIIEEQADLCPASTPAARPVMAGR